MSKVYVVSYDLNKSRQDYKGLYEKIEASLGYSHYLDSNSLISTKETANQIFERLRSSIDNNESILIMDAGKDYSGWLPEKAWEWVRQHVSFI